MRVLKKIILTTLFLCLMMTLSGITAFAQEKVHLRAATWDTAEGAHWVRVSFDKFEAEHPGIEIEVQSMPQGYDDRILTALAGGNSPELFMWWNYPGIALAGALEPLGGLGINFDTIYPTLNLYNSVKGEIYGVAKDFTTRVIWYNKEMFDKAGVPYPTSDWTWDEFRITAQKLTNLKEKIYGFLVLPGSYSWSPWVWSNGGALIDPTGTTMEGYLNSPGTIEAVRFLADLYLVDKVSPSSSTAQAMGGDYEMFTSNRVAMIDSGMWLLGYCKARGIDPSAFGTVMIPRREGKKRFSILHTCGWSMPKAIKYKKEAVEVLKFIADEGGRTMAEAGWCFPTNLSIAEETGFLTDPVTKAFFDALEYCTNRPSYSTTDKWWEKFDLYIAQAFDKIILKKATAKDALNWAIGQSEAALKE